MAPRATCSDRSTPPAERGSSAEDRDATDERFICFVCRQPVDAAAALRCRGEPVHADCW